MTDVINEIRAERNRQQIIEGMTTNKNTETLEVALCQELNDKLKRIAELEEALRGFKDQPHSCIDRGSSVTLLECPICILKNRARELLHG